MPLAADCWLLVFVVAIEECGLKILEFWSQKENLGVCSKNCNNARIFCCNESTPKNVKVMSPKHTLLEMSPVVFFFVKAKIEN